MRGVAGMGGRSSVGFDSRPPALWAWNGSTGPGMVRMGVAGRGKAWEVGRMVASKVRLLRRPRNTARQGFAWLGGAWQGAARQGTGGWSSLGFDSPAPTYGQASHGTAGRGEAWLGAVRHGPARRGGWRTSGFESRTPTHVAVLGPAGRGAAGTAGDWQPSRFEASTPTQGAAGCGAARRCWAGQGVAGTNPTIEGGV